MPFINPLQALVHSQTHKNYPAWIVNPQPQLFKICLFLVNRPADYELSISIFQAIDELVCSKNPNFLVILLGFEKLGLGLDNCGRTKRLLSHL